MKAKLISLILLILVSASGFIYADLGWQMPLGEWVLHEKGETIKVDIQDGHKVLFVFQKDLQGSTQITGSYSISMTKNADFHITYSVQGITMHTVSKKSAATIDIKKIHQTKQLDNIIRVGDKLKYTFVMYELEDGRDYLQMCLFSNDKAGKLKVVCKEFYKKQEDKMGGEQAVYIKLVRNVPLDNTYTADKIDGALKRADDFIDKYASERYKYSFSKSMNADGSFRLSVKCLAVDENDDKRADDNAHIFADYILSGEMIPSAINK